MLTRDELSAIAALISHERRREGSYLDPVWSDVLRGAEEKITAKLDEGEEFIPRIQFDVDAQDTVVTLLNHLAGWHVDLHYVEGQSPYCSNPVQILRTDDDGDLIVCEVVDGEPVTNATWTIPLSALKTVWVL